MRKWYYVYALYNSFFKKFYIGSTTNLKRRLKEHKKAKYPHRNRNFKLIFIEIFPNKQDALKREKYLKTTKGRLTLRAMLKNTLKFLK